MLPIRDPAPAKSDCDRGAGCPCLRCVGVWERAHSASRSWKQPLLGHRTCDVQALAHVQHRLVHVCVSCRCTFAFYLSCRSRHRGSQVGYPTACQTGRPTRAIGVRDTHQWIGKAAQVIGSAGGRTHGSNLAGCCEEPGIQTTKVQCDSLIAPPRPSHGYRQQGCATDLRVHVCFSPQYLPLSPRVNCDCEESIHRRRLATP